MTRIVTQRFRAAAFAATTAMAVGLTGPALAQDEDTLTIALPTFSDQTMTPWAGSGQRKTYLDLVYEYLVYLDEDQKPIPGLAESWEMEDEGKTWTFRLRDDVPFSGGHGTVDAEDVKYSIERLIADDSRAGPASTMRRIIETVETPDDMTVVVRLSAPDFLLDAGYFGEAQQLGIVSKDYIESQGDDADTAAPVGTGPYELERSVDGSEIIVSLREDTVGSHWRVNPEWERIAFKLVPEEATRVAMMRAGEADIAPVSFDAIPGLEDAGFRIVSAERTWSPVIRLGGMVQTDDRYNPDNPWADVRVRRAMNYAVDKQTIIDELFAGEGVPANADTPVRQWESIDPYPYDPERARELLAEAGYPDGFPVTIKTFTTTPGAELPLMAEAVALYWADVGIDATIEPVDWPTLRSEWTEGEARDYVWTHRGFPFANPENGVEAGFSTRSLFASFTSDELEEMLADLAEETDRDLRSEKLTEIGKYLRDEAAAVFMVLANEPYAVGPDVGDWQITTSYVYNFDQVEKAD